MTGAASVIIMIGVAFLAAFAMVPIARRIGAAPLHALSLIAAGIGMVCLPHVTSKALLFLPAVGIGRAAGRPPAMATLKSCGFEMPTASRVERKTTALPSGVQP